MNKKNILSINLHSDDVDLQRDNIRSLMGDRFFYKETLLGYKFITKIIDNYGLDYIFSEGNADYYSEPYTSRFVCEYSKNTGGIGIFAGGYIGDIAIPAAMAGLRAVAFEPDSDSRKLLEINCQLNGVKVQVSNLGLYENECEADLVGSDATSTIIAKPHESNKLSKRIALTTLDRYIAKAGIEPSEIKIMQFDMEGSECGAMLGCSELLSNYSPVLIIEIHSLYDEFRDGLASTKTCKILKSYGYKIFCLRDYNTHYQIQHDAKYELIPIDNCYLEGPHHGFNLIAFKGDAPLPEDRIKFTNGVSPKLIPHKSDNPVFAPTL